MKGKTQWEKLPYPYDTKRCKYPYYSLTNQLKPELPKGKSLPNVPEIPYEPWHYIPPHLSLDDPASSTFHHTPLGQEHKPRDDYPCRALLHSAKTSTAGWLSSRGR